MSGDLASIEDLIPIAQYPQNWSLGPWEDGWWEISFEDKQYMSGDIRLQRLVRNGNDS